MVLRFTSCCVGVLLLNVVARRVGPFFKIYVEREGEFACCACVCLFMLQIPWVMCFVACRVCVLLCWVIELLYLNWFCRVR